MKKATRGTVFAQAALERRADAEALLLAERYHSAVYMSGYVVECILKAAICRQRGDVYLPTADETHNLIVLLERAQLRRTLDASAMTRRAFDLITRQWSVDMRYQSDHGQSARAASIVTAASTVMAWAQRQLV